MTIHIQPAPLGYADLKTFGDYEPHVHVLLAEAAVAITTAERPSPIQIYVMRREDDDGRARFLIFAKDDYAETPDLIAEVEETP